MSKARDEQLGAAGEATFFSLLRKTHPHAIQQQNKYHRFDFFDPDSCTDFELKTRRCAVIAYPDLFISLGKVREGRNRVARGLSRATVFVWSFETPGWAGREFWAWRDDGRELDLTHNGNRSRGSADCELALIPRSLLLPWDMFVEKYAPTSMQPCETIKETYCPTHAALDNTQVEETLDELEERVRDLGADVPLTSA
tara:strand:- start:2154 stop:2747 length:594 start_codon:yes stop_codon:yes gene_type:complete